MKDPIEQVRKSVEKNLIDLHKSANQLLEDKQESQSRISQIASKLLELRSEQEALRNQLNELEDQLVKVRMTNETLFAHLSGLFGTSPTPAVHITKTHVFDLTTHQVTPIA